MRFDAIVQEATQVEGDLLERHLAGLDLRQIENVIQQCQQRVRATLGGLELLSLLRRQSAVEHDVHHPEYAAHRRAQFV